MVYKMQVILLQTCYDIHNVLLSATNLTKSGKTDNRELNDLNSI